MFLHMFYILAYDAQMLWLQHLDGSVHRLQLVSVKFVFIALPKHAIHHRIVGVRIQKRGDGLQAGELWVAVAVCYFADDF